MPNLPSESNPIWQLLDSGLESDDLVVIATGRDASDGAERLSAKLEADRADAGLIAVTWMGGTFAFLAGDFVLLASIHGSAWTTTDLVSVIGLSVGALASAVMARLYRLKAREARTKLAAARRILMRWISP